MTPREDTIVRKPTHTYNPDRFAEEMTSMGWRLDPAYGWISASGKTRVEMEKDYVRAILRSVHCPHEEAGID